jgi:hypothetical protein
MQRSNRPPRVPTATLVNDKRQALNDDVRKFNLSKRRESNQDSLYLKSTATTMKTTQSRPQNQLKSLLNSVVQTPATKSSFNVSRGSTFLPSIRRPSLEKEDSFVNVGISPVRTRVTHSVDRAGGEDKDFRTTQDIRNSL